MWQKNWMEPYYIVIRNNKGLFDICQRHWRMSRHVAPCDMWYDCTAWVFVSKVIQVAGPKPLRKHRGWRLGARLSSPMERNIVGVQPPTVVQITQTWFACRKCLVSTRLVSKISFAVEALKPHGFSCNIRLILQKLSIDKYLSVTKPFSKKVITYIALTMNHGTKKV